MKFLTKEYCQILMTDSKESYPLDRARRGGSGDEIYSKFGRCKNTSSDLRKYNNTFQFPCHYVKSLKLTVQMDTLFDF